MNTNEKQFSPKPRSGKSKFLSVSFGLALICSPIGAFAADLAKDASQDERSGKIKSEVKEGDTPTPIMKQSDRPDEWYRYCRIMLEWLNPKRNLDPESWVPEVVERAQNLKVNALAFDFWHGGFAIFNGSVVPKDDHVGTNDILALLDREVHKRGMYLVAMNMGAHANNYAAEEYPGWRAVDAQGKPMPFAHGFLMCRNSPYGNLLFQELTEMLPRYHIDGLYVEGLYQVDCYCEFCSTEFERTYGYPIPKDPQSAQASPDYKRFRANEPTDFVRRLRKVIDQVSPRTILMPSPSSWEGTRADFAAWGTYADAVSLERQWGFNRNGVKLFEMGMSMQSIRAESKRPPMGTVWLGWQVDADYSPSTPEHYRLNFFEIFMNGATPQLHAQTIFEVDASGMPIVREMFALEERCRPYLLDADFVSYAALVVDWSNFSASENAKGYYRALVEAHVPFTVISKQDLRPDELSRYKVLLLPNVERLSNEHIKAIHSFQAKGGGVVLTYRTGLLEENGFLRHGEYPFLKLAGIRGPFRIVSNPFGSQNYTSGLQNYYKIIMDHPIGAGTLDRLQSFSGSYAEMEPTTGKVIANVLDYDYSKMHRHHPVMGRYPGHPIAPLIVVDENKGQGGRVAYFAGEFDKKSFDTGLPGTLTTLAEAAIWAAAAVPPVQVEVSPNVRVTTQFSAQRKTHAIMLLNQTTNDMEPGKVIHYVQPLRDVKITLNGVAGKVRAVRSMTDASLKYENEGKTCVITLGELKEYEVIIVELAD